MCEFKVYLDGDQVMRDVVLARVEENGVLLTDVIGDTKKVEDCRIVKVNVLKTMLLLEKVPDDTREIDTFEIA